ncbi:hypothetical protein [Streptomyces chryseus]|uniref:hypothetical protein n=1 Tax=Streptomyces chryseus TaxID=68186 RepID=UPI00110FC44E|nr:hypothetical protein [Streptomyces chryseus]GGX40030.1 hypothetical protein GCM10010353_64360 [Streptomyces chryseus]
MSTIVIIVIIVAVVVVLALVALALRTTTRRRQLRERFGPEYERTVEAKENRGAAERDLLARQERHESLEIEPLPAAVRDRYARDWTSVQEHFVDRPDQAVGEADRLVTTLMSERGYPTENYEQQTRDLSVEHSRTLEHYRAAHEINKRAGGSGTSTEELRSAMVHYRALFEELLHDGAGSPDDKRP